MGILHAFLPSADFFFKSEETFRKIISGTPPECQRVWIQIRPDVLSGLIWVLTVLQKLSVDDTSRPKSACSHFNGRRIFFRKRIGIVPMRKPFHSRCFE